MKVTGSMLFAAAAGMLLLAPTGYSQERGKGGGDCGMKTLEKGVWCEKCDKLLEKSDLKDGKHDVDGCGEKPKEVEVCVKKFYAADCHPNKTAEKPGS